MEHPPERHLSIVILFFSRFDAQFSNIYRGNIKPVEVQDLKQHLIPAEGNVMFSSKVFKNQNDLLGDRELKNIQMSF
jgi:hypothetical protein